MLAEPIGKRERVMDKGSMEDGQEGRRGAKQKAVE